LPLAAWEQSPGIPPEPSSWLQYTPPGESGPRAEQPQTYDFGRVNNVMDALQSGEFVPQQPYDPTAGWKYPPGSRQYGMGTAVMPQRDRGSELGAGGFGFEPRFEASSSAQPVTIVQANGQVLTRDPVTGEWR